MSAAQPVEGEGTPAAALGTRRGKLAKRRYSVAGIPRVPGFDGQEERLTALADDIEISLNTVGYTLSDDDTAAVYRHTRDARDGISPLGELAAARA